MLITDLNLSSRVKNVLKSKNINTLEELLNTTEEYLITFRGLGSSGFKEIKEVVADYCKNNNINLNKEYSSEELESLGFDVPLKSTNLDKKLLSKLLSKNYKTVGDVINFSNDDIVKVCYGVKDGIENWKEVFDTYSLDLGEKRPTIYLDVTPAMLNNLEKLNVKTVGDIPPITLEDVKKIRSVGDVRANEIFDVIQEIQKEHTKKVIEENTPTLSPDEEKLLESINANESNKKI